MKYAAFMVLEKGQFRELSYFELKDTISEGKPYYVVKVDCASIKEYEQIRFLDNATITLKDEISGVFRTSEEELCARVAYSEF